MTLSCIEINPFIEFENILELFSAKTDEKNIKYNSIIDKRIPSLIMIDKLRISQVLSNLIGNAIKFTPNNGSIEVNIILENESTDELELKFSVKDSGIGIAKDRQKLIFEAFAQADDSTTREFGGTGLGLSISVSLVELMQGSFYLVSKEGEGSTFGFTIKSKVVEIIPKKVIQKEKKLETKEKPFKEHAKVLVVEDNEMNQILMDELLKKYKISVDFVSNGEEAIFKVSEVQYDLVFMDINMPILNGIDTGKFIRASGNEVPIIALTANALEGDEEKFLNAGMNAYLAKPLVFEDFDKLVKKYLT
ncbi:MAG TPA: response regulator [Sulfurimonas sp.]|nr:response regulator [Sulfurimonas sp.]